MDAGGRYVKRDLAHGDPHASRALVAEAQDALVVGDHDEPHVGIGSVPEGLVDTAAMLGGDPEPARAPEDPTVFLARSTDRRCDDGQELLEVVGEHAIEKVLVAVLDGGQSDEALERIVFPHDVAVGAPCLHVLRGHGGGQKAVEPEGPALVAGERGRAVVHRMIEKLGAPKGHLHPLSAARVALSGVGFRGEVLGSWRSADQKRAGSTPSRESLG
jgi:hypothetical protein